MIFMNLLGPQLAGHRAEDTGADRLVLLGDQHGGIAVEADRCCRPGGWISLAVRTMTAR